jgi:nucleotidyltransferase substrate binding protein (TIGR01987 family)
MSDISRILSDSAARLQKAVTLVIASTKRVGPYDEKRTCSADEMEPYDALASRFERSVEVALMKFFRAVELSEVSIASDTIRDRLGLMLKLSLISDVDLWLRMRDVRDRISHDYLPEDIKAIYDDILQLFVPELVRLQARAEELVKRLSS